MEKTKIERIDKVKNITIILLVILLLVLTFYLIFSKINVSGNVSKSEFLRYTNELQASISYYLGSMNSDTFGVYNNEQILTGTLIKDNGEKQEIKNNNDEKLTPIVNIETKVERNGKVAYQINKDNIKKALNVQLQNFSGVKWFIQDDKVRVQVDARPDWWSNDFDYLEVGNY